MKKLLILPILLVCMVGASPRRTSPFIKPTASPSNVSARLDSLGIKLNEVEQLIKQTR